MGILKRLADEELIELRPAHSVGRTGLDNDLAPAPDDTRVSRWHARLCWELTHWRLRDTSTNGTALNGEVVRRDDRELREGDSLVFCEGGSPYVLIDASPPWTAAVPVDGGEAIPPEGNRLVLGPGRTLDRRSSTGEWAWTGGGRVADGERVEVDGRAYTMHLPQIPDVTVVASAAKNEWTLRVLASRRSGAVAVQLESPVRTVSLGAYAYFGAIKVLAEERLADEGLPFAEQGWLHPQAVGQALGMPQATLRVHLHRVRELLRAEGFADLAPIYEARATGEVRLGCARVVVDERD